MTEPTPPSYRPGDVVNGHVLNADGQWVPVAAAPVVKIKKPIYKRWWFIAAAVVVAIIVVSSVAGGGDDTPAADTPVAGDQTPPDEEPTDKAPVNEEPEGPGPQDVVPGVGDKVRDGKFEFKVTKVKTGVNSVGSDFLTESAQGSYTLVTMTVENIGDEAQDFSSSQVDATDGKDRELESDWDASYAANKGGLADTINPGNSIKATIAFDVAKGQKLKTVVLHDSVFSNGVSVTL